MQMDPLIVLSDEIERANNQATLYEQELTAFRNNNPAFAEDLRYHQMVAEKMEAMKSVTGMRLELAKRATAISEQGLAIYSMEKDGCTTYFLDSADPQATTALPTIGEEELKFDRVPTFEQSSQTGLSSSVLTAVPEKSTSPAAVLPPPLALFPQPPGLVPGETPPPPPFTQAPLAHAVSATAALHTHTAHSAQVQHQQSHSPHTSFQQTRSPQQMPQHMVYHPHTLPPLHKQPRAPPSHMHPPQSQQKQYVEAKNRLAGIMRDHSELKIYFVGLDGHMIAAPEHQMIRRCIKGGEDPAQFMRGEYRSYPVSYVKKSNSYVQNRLFFPEFHPY